MRSRLTVRPFLSIGLGLLLAACASTPTGGESVSVVEKARPECTYLGEASGKQSHVSTTTTPVAGTGDASAREQLRSRASEMGGNTLVPVRQRKEVRVLETGAIYRCP